MNCFIVDRYNYRTHGPELLYADCLKRCSDSDDGCGDDKCTLLRVRDVKATQRLNRTHDKLCISEEKIREVNETIGARKLESFNLKKFNFNGFINGGQTVEYNYTTTADTLEVEIVMSPAQSCLDFQIIGPQGRYVGEGSIPPGPSGKVPMPEAEYYPNPCRMTRVLLKDPSPGIYSMRVYQNKSYVGKENFDILVREASKK